MGVIDDIQKIGKVLQKAGQIGLYEKLLAIQEKALDIQQQNALLQKEIVELKEELKIKGSLIFRENAYYLINEQANKTDGPYCSKCYDDEKKLIHLSPLQNTNYLKCPKCNSSTYVRPGRIFRA